MRRQLHHFSFGLIGFAAALICPLVADAAGYASTADDDIAAPPSLKQQALNLLPPAVRDELDVTAWGWFSDYQTDHNADPNEWDAEISLAATKSFNQRLAITAQGNFIDADDIRRGELEQGYASVLLDEQSGSILTVGKFNSQFGVEARDFWDRTTGTTSLLFAAQPQDLAGVMLTQPIGDGNLKLRPFISSDFQGQFYFNQSPAAGLSATYQPQKQIDLTLTDWVGPGFVPVGGRPIHEPFFAPEYSGATGGWQGPNLDANAGGTLEFVDANAAWQIRPDLKLCAEYLYANTAVSAGHFGWYGFLFLADYDLTDRLHFFGQWSFLDDSDSLVTGVNQTTRELSCGLGYELWQGVEIRGEYRHDYSNSTDPDGPQNVDTVSAHLTFTY